MFCFLAGGVSNKIYHIEFNPPPQGSQTGLNRVETISSTKDASNDKEQLQNRLVLFDQEWKSMRQFYEKYTRVSVAKLNETFKSKEVAHEIQRQLDEFVSARERKRLEELEEKRILEELILQKQREEAEEAQRKQMEKEAAEAEKVAKELEAQKAQAAAESKLPLIK